MKPRKVTAEKFVKKQFDRTAPSAKPEETDRVHYGKCEVKQLLNFLYGERNEHNS